MNIYKSLKNTPIAVVGLSAMFADAHNVEEFWTNIIQSKDSIIDVPDSRWSIKDYYDEDMFAPDKTYCKKGGFLPDIDFDPMEFGLPPNILEVTDASQLLSLVAARDAFEDAGYGQNSPKFTKELREKTGVVLGVGGGQKLITPLIARLQYPIWERALRSSGISEEDIPMIVDKMKKAYIGWNENSFPGLLGNVISGRITNRFDLGGINSVVDAACAASLSAIRMALSELIEGRCDMMLTGGVDTDNSPFMYMSFSKTPAFSKSGKISPFSDAADGMLIGEGIGMLVLKRLEDAERDGDKIYALIKGVGTSSDGRYKSVYAPRPAGQALAMTRTYEDAGFSPQTVGLIEAHGTGTGAGDPTEFTSMEMVFGKDNPKKQHIALGSVKSQVGHTKSAAGAAGMIKAVLALYHKVLPATINVDKPNHKFNIENSPIYINTQTRPWFENKHPRRASVSAFGFGGINVHFAMEEYKPTPLANDRLHTPFQNVILHAANAQALIALCKETKDGLLSANAKNVYYNIVKQSENVNIPAAHARVGFVVENVEEAIEKLNLIATSLNGTQATWEHPKGIFFRAAAVSQNDKVVALFSGQGAQYVGMGAELANAFPEVHETIAQFDNLFTKDAHTTLSERIFPIPVFSAEEVKTQQANLTQTQFAQPAIGSISMGMYKTLRKAGFKAELFAGHSFGELTALWAAEVLTDEQYRFLAKARGQAMAKESGSTDAGSMLAVKASQEQITPLLAQLNGISIANINSPNQLVLGGSTSAIASALVILKSKGFDAVQLPVSAAFHTSFVGHAQQPFAQAIKQTPFASPRFPVYANSNAKPYPTFAEAIKTILSNHILQPVHFKTQIENMYAAGGRIFVEFGPKSILTNLVKDILKDKPHFAIALNANPKKNSDQQFRQAVVQMQVLGLPIAELDTYNRPQAAPKALSKMNVKLGGHNYVSAPTKKAYQDVLNNGFQVAQAKPITIVEKVVEKVVETVIERVEVEVQVPAPVAETVEAQVIENHSEEMNKEVINLIQETVNSFTAQQNKSLEIFERFLSDQNKQSLAIIEMLGKCFGNENNTDKQLAAPVEQPAIVAAPVKEVVTATPHTNRHSNGNGNGHAHKTVVAAPVAQVIEKPAPAPIVNKVVEAPVAAPVVAAANDLNVTAILMEVVSEKTGYPAEMLELSMDMEADLGIDSIKRVEIFGAITEQHPEITGINPQELAELRTLEEIVAYISGKNITSAPAAKTVAPAPVAKEVVKEVVAPAPVVVAAANDLNVTAILMEVVSEKTGYPAEMLELSMDMEADLGIDSIKRVEIFGAITEQHPEITGINPQELAELRTLAEIVTYISSKNIASSPSQKVSVAPTAVPAAKEIVTPAPIINTAAVATANDLDVTAILMEVVSEKTGYPAEMLELGMDMEADLGIDSIKRVEIFGAITEQHPQITGINPQELAELRTLAEIVTYISSKNITSAPAAKTVAAAPAPVVANENAGLSSEKVTAILMEVVSEKTGYPAEMLELTMDMEADLGIDSIKRVEIFGAITEQHPEVTGINPQELAELRTLQEIVDYLCNQSKKKTLITA